MNCRCGPGLFLGSDPVVVSIQVPPEGSYEGDYEVAPSAAGTVLPTAGKTMREDLVIAAIPVREEPNGSGGRTLTIG